MRGLTAHLSSPSQCEWDDDVDSTVHSSFHLLENQEHKQRL